MEQKPQPTELDKLVARILFVIMALSILAGVLRPEVRQFFNW